MEVQLVEEQSNTDENPMDIRYFCGKCELERDPGKTNKCPTCKKKLIKWFKKSQSLQDIKYQWNIIHDSGKFRFLKSELWAFAVIWVGVFITGIIMWLFFKNYFISFDSAIDPKIFSQFGDIIGGFVGAIWSLSGVILFYLALKNQIRNSNTNQDLLFTQIGILNQQLKEYKEQIRQSDRIATASEQTNRDLEDQITIMKENLQLDKIAILVNAYANISRSETNINLKNENLIEARSYLKMLVNSVKNERDSNI